MSTRLKVFLFIIIAVICVLIFIKNKNPNVDVIDHSLELGTNSQSNVLISYFNIYSSHSPVDLIITNDLKQRLGENSITAEKFTEIPNAYQAEEGYESEGSIDFYPQVISLFENPITGSYSIQVIGIEDTDYTLYISSDAGDASDTAEISSTIKKGEIEEFVATLSEDGNVNIQRK